MDFDISVRKTPALDSKSLADKNGFMNIRQSINRNALDNNYFRKNSAPAPVQSPVQPAVQSPVRYAVPVQMPLQQQQPVRKKSRNLPSGNVFLQKGQKVTVENTEKIKIAVGWDILDGRCELDASAFMLGKNGKVSGDEWFIFYGQNVSPDNSVCYFSNCTPDDAVIDIDLRKISPDIEKIVISVTIYEAYEKGLDFSMTENVYSRIISDDNNELFRFRLDECYSNVTSMVLGELYRYKGMWKFNAVGAGVSRDLAGFCAMYGVNIL
ncbi:MAG: TerD family protein [Ruminococcus sp.]|nr:TerD family protein [Ruminococcus sp.]